MRESMNLSRQFGTAPSLAIQALDSPAVSFKTVDITQRGNGLGGLFIAFMQESTNKQFGIVVAYILPGFILLAGVAPVLPAIARWLNPVDQGELGIGPPVYAVLGATALGLLLSCFRWLLLDHLHQWTGVKRPQWDDRRLATSLGSFDYLVQNHFRYYEFCGNSLLAVIVSYSLNRLYATVPFLGLGTDLLVLMIALVLFAASRDALSRYYRRTTRLIGNQTSERRKDVQR